MDGINVPHCAVLFVDSEFQHRDGERDQRPICLVAKEWYSGKVIELWEDDLRRLTQAPFDVGPRSIIVTFGAFAELGTFDALGWRRPCRVLDLYPEFRCQDNDAPHKSGSLLAALAKFDLPHMATEDKEANRRFILDQDSWTETERRRILRYCRSDVEALELLLPVLLPGIGNIDEAFLRSDYMVAITDIGQAGIPMDVPVLRFVQGHWDDIRIHIAAEAQARYGTFPGGKWSYEAAEQYLGNAGMLDAWPCTEKTGRLAFDNDTFREMSRLYPQLHMLREARSSLGKVRPVDLDIGSDGRCRAKLFAFGTTTGRNAPKKFPFAPATWTRSFMRPFPGRAVAYLDYSGQELGLAAAYSQDRSMECSYLSGDFYLATAQEFGMAPPDATKRHPARDVAKTVCLGLNYGMTNFGLAYRLNIGFAEADELLHKHRATYPRFSAYADAMVNSGMWHSRLTSSFGWQYQVSENANSRALRNFPLQAGGGDMLRLAVIGLRAAGITVIATVHDAVLIEASAQDIDGYVAIAKEIMAAASVVVTGSFPLRVDHRIFRPGERYFDARGVPMWNRIARWSRALTGGADLVGASDLSRGVHSSDLVRAKHLSSRSVGPVGRVPNKEESIETIEAIGGIGPTGGIRPITGQRSAP
jgi:hypothetical protein